MDLKQVKRMAADVMKVGVSKIRINKPEEAVQAMTKDDVRTLIGKRAIEVREFRSPSRGRARKIAAQKKKGRRKGRGKNAGLTERE
ncbi:MAG: 50S ribosomal protein L19e [archaeon]